MVEWGLMHEGPVRVWFSGLCERSVGIQMNGQTLSYALDTALQLLCGKIADRDSYEIQYFGVSSAKDYDESVLVVTRRTGHPVWGEVCDAVEKGAFLEIHHRGRITLGRITAFSWDGGILCLAVPRRVWRLECSDNGWKEMPMRNKPIRIDPTRFLLTKDTRGWFDFQLPAQGSWAVIRTELNGRLRAA